MLLRTQVTQRFTALQVDTDRSASAGDAIGMLIKESDLAFQFVRHTPIIIVVENGNIFAASAGQAEVVGLRDIAWSGTVEVAQARFAAFPVLQDRGDLIVGAVVNHEELPIGKGL